MPSLSALPERLAAAQVPPPAGAACAGVAAGLAGDRLPVVDVAPGSAGSGVVLWHGTLIRQLSPEQIEELLIATGRDTDPEVVLAKVKWLIKSTTPNVFAYVVDLLKGRLETARADRDSFAATIQELRHNIDLWVVANKRIEQERGGHS